MVKWWDWIIAFVWAGIMMALLAKGVTAPTWWEPLFYGFVTGMVYRFWRDYYCIYRLAWEIVKNDKHIRRM